MKLRKSMLSAIILLVGILMGCGQLAPKQSASEEPEVITVWNYYNGPQMEAFDDLVQQFNQSVGKEKNIVVEAVSKGSLDGLIQAVTESAEEQIGSEKLPQLCAAYADTALELDQMGLLADIAPYISEEEKEAYVDAYLKEGQFSADASIKIFPTAKSTEVFTLNTTAWEPFAREMGVNMSELATWEGIACVAEKYYKWTDEKTPEPEDGKAFFGRDAVANYMLAGSFQLGHDILHVENGAMQLEFDEKTMKHLWDNYYIPYIKGYYIEEGRFRSDDLKMGSLIAYVGSTSGALYTPEKVVYEDGRTEDIVCQVLPVPNFEGCEPVAVQQGGGMVLFHGEEKTERAAVEFLKWFTDKEANLAFCIESGYLPVRKDANHKELLEQTIAEQSGEFPEILRENLLMGIDEVNSYTLYTTKPFDDGNKARSVLNTTITEYAKADREAVKEMIQNGYTAEEAIEILDTEKRFSEWYIETYTQLKGFCESK